MNKQFSVLFLYVFTTWLLCVHINSIQAQSSIDSTNYYFKLAMNPKEDTDLARAYDFFTKHKEDCLKNNYPEGAIHDLSVLAVIQNESGFYYDSETSAIEAIALLDRLEISPYTTNSKITLYNELGKTSRALMDFDRALLYYTKAYSIAKEPKERNIILNNRAMVYMEQQKYDLALVELQKAYDISVSIQNEKEIARNLDNIGYAKFKLHKPDAITLLESALQKRLQINDKTGLYASYKHLFDYYQEQKDEAKAISNLNHALAIANDLNSASFKLDVLSDYVDRTQDSLMLQYKTLNDEVKTANLLTANKYTSKKYDLTKTELEAQQNKNGKERAQILIGVVILLGLFSYLFMRTKHKKDNILQVYKTEARLSKKIHDELANDMSDVMNYVETDLQATPEHKTALLNTLEDLYVRTRDISTETGSIDFQNFATSLRHLLVQHNKKEVKVILGNIDAIDWKALPEHKKLTVYRCLQELMVNMKKHSQAKLVTIAFKKVNKTNEIWYTDDGLGTALETIKERGLGNAEIRIKEIGGSLTFETSHGHGFKAIIRF